MYDANLSLLWNQDVLGANITSDFITLDEVGSLLREAGGEPMEVFVPILEDFAGGTILTLALITSDDETGTSTQVQNSVSVPVASLTAGSFIKISLSSNILDTDAAFLGVDVIPIGTFTSGSLSAVIQRSNENQTTINSLQ